jgi:hypothetical protein
MFIDALKQKKSSLKQSSILTYFRNIKRLRRVHGKLPVPEKDHKWLLSEKLVKWYDDQPLSVRRHMATAANIALDVYGKPDSDWKKRQRDSMEQFDEDRRKRKLTDKQKSAIPVKGFDSLKRVITQMRRELKHVITKIETQKDLLRVQELLIMSLYYDIPLRLDYATMKIGKAEHGNSIYKQKKKPAGWHIELHDFKTAKSLGPKKFKLNTANQRLLNKFIPAVEKITDHGYLLTNQKGGKMSKQVLSKTLMRISKARIGKKFGVQLLRILYAMRNRDVIETAKEVSEKLLHSQKQSLEYAKKDD